MSPRAVGRCAAVVLLVTATLATACAPEPLAAPSAPSPAPVDLPPPTEVAGAPSGRVTVAYPVPPSRFLQPVGEEPAADDLAALWGLPLLRVGPDGQLRRGLVADWEVLGTTDAGWEVLLHLRQGRWTDGEPVGADDVVATLRRRMREEPERFGAISRVGAPARDQVRLVLHRPHAGWSDLLLQAGSVLPAELGPDADDAFADEVPVSGGPFRLREQDPGRRLVFAAHEDGPLGPPRLDRLVVLFTPSFETALGLLERGEVDAAVGHLALNPVARAEELDGVRAAAPLGGTTVALTFRADGDLGGPDTAVRRRAILDAVDVRELVEGLLGPHGEVASSPWSGVPAPARNASEQLPGGTRVTLVHPQDGEAFGFTARAVQRDLRARDVTVDLVPWERPAFTEVARTSYDAALQVRRTGPRPSLVDWVDAPELARSAEAAGPGTAAVRDGLAAVASAGRLGPLYRVGVAHAWQDVEGIRPSSWLGAGFWNVGEWARGS